MALSCGLIGPEELIGSIASHNGLFKLSIKKREFLHHQLLSFLLCKNLITTKFFFIKNWSCMKTLYKWSIVSSLIACAGIYADDQQVTPQLIQEELVDAEQKFKEAKEMFNPWYAGPILAPSAHVITPGMFNIQPYLFVTDNYATYDKNGKSHDIKDIVSINPQFVFLFGMFKRVEGIISIQSVTNMQGSKSKTGFGDMNVNVGIGLLEETLYQPALLLSIQETFPTGKYNQLQPQNNGLDAIGGGAYKTTVSLNIAKCVWWIMTHPINFRASASYTFPSIARVKGYHAYGGGLNTDGKIHTPNAFAFDGAFEYSFTQRWVIACDFVYNYSAKTIFVGKNGKDTFGNKAINGAPFRDSISLAPALEYNPSGNLGVLAGVWFSVWGRNTLDFVSGVVSVTYMF
jgi:hypothetical protein